MIVAAIDSAELAGLAVVSRDDAGAERLLYHRATRILLASDVGRVVAELLAFGPDAVVVEEPFIHPRNPGTGLVLSRLVGRWMQEIERSGITALSIPASAWQTSLLAGVGYRTKSADRKLAAQAFVRERFGFEATEDEADAVCLGVYTLRHATRRPAPARKVVANGR